MKNLFVLIVILLIGSLAHSQKITVHVTEAQEFIKGGKHDFRKVVTDSDKTEKAYKTDAEYVFDLENKSYTFSSESTRGSTSYTIYKIDKTTLNGMQFFTFERSWVSEKYGKMTKMFDTIVINIDANLMWYTMYDKFARITSTLAYKGKITLN